MSGGPDPRGDARWMSAALALARRGLGQTWPNPAVGCVIVKDGRLIGRGSTRPGGRPHAEAVALEAAATGFGAEALRGATAYITLEPCAHHGRTPPCAEALTHAGIARVVAPMADPDPRVDGRGFALLREAGIEVTVGPMAAEAEALNPGFLARMRGGRPHLLLKLAATLDGRIATAAGESRWITGPLARRRVHLMRAAADALLVGAGTARADNPMLDVRLAGLEGRSPVRVVADPSLSLSLTSRLAATAGERPLWLLHRAGAAPDRAAAWTGIGARLIEVPHDPETGSLRLTRALELLGDFGVNSILCEGGAALAAALLREDLVDCLAWFGAGTALGGDARAAVGALALKHLADAGRFALAGIETMGPDILSHWRRD